MARQPSGDSSGDDSELRGSPKMGTAVISGINFRNKSVVYYDVEGTAIVEGDICLGSTDEIEQTLAAARDVTGHADGTIAFGVGISGSRFRWPNCVVPYEIDPNLPNQRRVTDAIAHWEANTPFRFPLRTPANAGQYPNYVRFTDAGGCWSRLGMQTGQQTISLGSGCSTGNSIHEIGHAVGLWHEQSREDRDLFVTINWQNIQSGMAAQFNQHITDGDDLGAYDYGSIMHYPRTAFSKNGQDTIVPTDPNAQIGQRSGLSVGDIAAVRAMYPGCGIKRPWTEPPFKKFRDDIHSVKKLRDDQVVVKPIRDLTKPPRDPGPVKMTMDPITTLPGTISTLPGTLQPFSIATPHHAVATNAGADADAQSMSYLSMLQQQMLDLDAAIAQAKATAAQATAEAARLQQASDGVVKAMQDAVDMLDGMA